MCAQHNKQPTDTINSIYELPSLAQVMKYQHDAAGHPTKSMWIKAINAGFFALWPMLTAGAVINYFPKSTETQKGYMRQQRHGV